MASRRAGFVMVAPKQNYNRGEYWQESATCRGTTESEQAIMVGYPHKRDAEDIEKRFCRKCPVIAQCLDWAVDDKHFTGIAAGRVFVGGRGAGERRVIVIRRNGD